MKNNTSDTSRIETLALVGLLNSFADRCPAEELGRVGGLNEYRFDCQPVTGDWLIVSAVTMEQGRSILFHELRRMLIES